MNNVPNKIVLTLDGDVQVDVKGIIAPIGHTLSHFHIEWDALANLQVIEPEKIYPASVFRSFLPSEPVSVAECWKIEESGVLDLFQQLNTEPNLDMHIDSGDSRGLWACLRAYNDRYVDIAFRTHAEFKLDGGWLTPSQFSGNLIVDRIEKQIASFKMYIPEGTVNLDINWDSADAGFCSRMELQTGTENLLQYTDFKEEITKEAAERALTLCFYKSERINWVSPFKAIELSEDQVKLIHVISIDGPLKDESC